MRALVLLAIVCACDAEETSEAQPESFDANAVVETAYGQLRRAGNDPKLAAATIPPLEDALLRAPNDPRVLFALGWANHLAKNHVVAETRYREADLYAQRAKQPQIRFFSRFNLAALYEEQRHFAVAAAEFQEAGEIGEGIASQVGTQLWNAWYRRGRVLATLERTTEALLAYDRAAKFAPNSGAIRLEKGLVLCRIGKADLARVELAAAVKMTPTLASRAVCADAKEVATTKPAKPAKKSSRRVATAKARRPAK